MTTIATAKAPVTNRAPVEWGRTALHVRVQDKVVFPVTFSVAGIYFDPEVRLEGDEALVKIPMVLRVVAEVEGCDSPSVAEQPLTLVARVPPGQSFTSVQWLEVTLPLDITAGLAPRVKDVRLLDARRVAPEHSYGK